ncbi:class I SAM-dependent methyltransferase [Sphingomonas sp. RP10(2022)]|uniref:Class I SAM-dependent methyltransferase n=1 Tax=Sphingomonas liriopis TaxID=2949094 RepID=A0A9X2HPE8_9SPHN|nr:class I SAM-dependent methyltransferase [Sphingomonas liriopis]MCP3733327.1 class I SAM-dependent methyltransferase [Sphingomonas liriopis]
MSGDVQRHYDDLLAAHYSWMNALSFDEKVAEQRAFLLELGVEVRSSAVDLGCGPGYQTIALDAMGFRTILAIDTSRNLLDELEGHRGSRRSIRTELADMRRFPKLVEDASVDTIICMGDTLTHLDDRRDVSTLFRDAHACLRSGGQLALTFRDLSMELTGLDRFLPVRADDGRIMICALDYEEERVVVNDLIHIRSGDGWTLHKSSYRKLRLKPSGLVAELEGLGFAIEQDRPSGRMHAIVARKA